jgi:WhiB family redox-sensing transcriptional regulator
MSLDDYYLPHVEPADQSWRDHAACKGLDTNLFFPERGDMLGTRIAIRVCETCPVQTECRDYSLQFSENTISGIWGGMSGLGRRKHRRGK